MPQGLEGDISLLHPKSLVKTTEFKLHSQEDNSDNCANKHLWLIQRLFQKTSRAFPRRSGTKPTWPTRGDASCLRVGS